MVSCSHLPLYSSACMMNPPFKQLAAGTTQGMPVPSTQLPRWFAAFEAIQKLKQPKTNETNGTIWKHHNSIMKQKKRMPRLPRLGLSHEGLHDADQGGLAATRSGEAFRTWIKALISTTSKFVSSQKAPCLFLFFFCWRKRKMQKLRLDWNYWSIILFRVGWRQIIHCLNVCLSVSIMINSVASLGRDLIEVSDQTICLTWHFAGKAPKCHHGLITWHRPLHTTGHLEPPGSCAKTTWDNLGHVQIRSCSNRRAFPWRIKFLDRLGQGHRWKKTEFDPLDEWPCWWLEEAQCRVFVNCFCRTIWQFFMKLLHRRNRIG